MDEDVISVFVFTVTVITLKGNAKRGGWTYPAAPHDKN